MPAGMQIWDAAGTLIVDATTRMGGVLGTVSFYGASAGTGGSSYIANLSQGTPFFVQLTSWNIAPTITISGDTFYWHFDYTTPTDQLFTYIVGYW